MLHFAQQHAAVLRILDIQSDFRLKIAIYWLLDHENSWV
jgi:hypothetical protein